MQKAVLHIKNKILSIKINRTIIFLTGFLLGGANVLDGIFVFGVGAAISYLKRGFKYIWVILPVLGYMLGFMAVFKLKYILSCLLLCVLKEILSKTGKKEFFDKLAILVYPLLGLFEFAVLGFSTYDIFFLIIESVVLYYFVRFYDRFLDYFSSKNLRRTIKENELCAIITVAAVCVTAGAYVELPLGITPAGIIAAFVIMFCALEFGISASAVSGIVLGLAVSVTNPNMVFCIGSYSASGLFGGLSKKYGKAGIILTFIITNALVTFYVNGSEEVLINLFDVLIAAGLFLLCPKSKLAAAKENLLLLMASERTREAKRLGMIKEFTFKKLEKLSKAFGGLADSLKTGDVKKLKSGEETKMLAQNVAERVCKRCKNCGNCWGKNQLETLGVLISLVVAVERRGWAENYDVPGGFKNMCYNYQTLVLETNKVYELYRVNTVWENKLAENKEIMSHQLESMGEIVKNMAVDLKDSLVFETEYEKQIIMLLDELGIKVKETSVIPESGRIKVIVTVKDCVKKGECERILKAVVEKVVKKNMRVSHDECRGDLCTVEYTEKENFTIKYGVSRIRPENEKVSGDSYAVMTPGNGKTIVALSDGMGTGEKAAEESGITIDLLEKLLGAGINREAAIKLINSVLILKSYDESFATLDMLVFDMYSGMGEFIKTGGVASYIKRGRNVITVTPGSLPTGIIGSCDASNYRLKLARGDVIVILSDGVTDAFCDDRMIVETIKNADTENMKYLSDMIMKKAVDRLGVPRDDMTVISSLIQ